MKRRMRIQYTETDKALVWERWRQGESVNKIARLFDRHHAAIGGILSRTGGIRPPPLADLPQYVLVLRVIPPTGRDCPCRSRE
jgi:hypothetical protein